MAIECDFPDPATGLSCCWPVDTEKCCPADTDETPEHEAMVQSAAQIASAMLTRFSGYTIGQCAVSIRPLGNCRECRTRCCGGADGIVLTGPHGLWIESVTEVRIGPDVVDPATYHFDQEQQVLWRVPDANWPKRDQRWAADGTGEAFVVDVVVGSEPDAWALSVANLLVCELIKSCTGQQCRLPKNATQVVGQGITVTLTDQEIRMQLPEVAAWVDSVNPLQTNLPSRVHSPDIGPHRRGEWW